MRMPRTTATCLAFVIYASSQRSVQIINSRHNDDRSTMEDVGHRRQDNSFHSGACEGSWECKQFGTWSRRTLYSSRANLYGAGAQISSKPTAAVDTVGGRV